MQNVGQVGKDNFISVYQIYQGSMYMYGYVCIVLYPVDSSIYPVNVHNKVQHRKRMWYIIWHVQYLVTSYHIP